MTSAGSMVSSPTPDRGHPPQAARATRAISRHVAVSPDGRYVATSSVDKTAKVWDADTGRLVQTIDRPYRAPLPDGLLPRQPIAPDREPRQHRAALGHRDRRRDPPVHRSHRRCLRRRLHARRPVRDHGQRRQVGPVWDLASPLEADTLAGQISFIYAVDFSPDGSRIFTGSADGTGRLWDATSREVIARALHGQSRGPRRLLARWSIPPGLATRTGRPSCGTSPAPPWSASWMARREASRLISRPMVA